MFLLCPVGWCSRQGHTLSPLGIAQGLDAQQRGEAPRYPPNPRAARGTQTMLPPPHPFHPFFSLIHLDPALQGDGGTWG